MRIWTAAILILLACGCAIHTSTHYGKTATLGVGEKTSFGKRHRTSVQVLKIDETHHRATVEVCNRDFKERVWVQSGEFAQTTLVGNEVIKLVSIDGERAVLEMRWAENH
jgi:hypothetical protein